MNDFHNGGPDFSTPATTSGVDWLRQFTTGLKRQSECAPRFATAHEMARISATMRLRRAGKAKSEVRILVIPPLAVHDAAFVDLMKDHSLVQVLRETTRGAVYVADWIAATPEMRHLGIDDYLADLNVALDDIGGPVHVVGLSQGGLLAAMLAARFPQKIAKLVLAGTPLDLQARESDLAIQARRLARARDGLPEDDVIDGKQWLGQLGASQLHERGVIETLQRNPGSFTRADLEAVRLFEEWTRRSLDIPGRYAREMLAHVLSENQLARRSFVALGRRLDLKAIRAPLFVLAGAYDFIAPREQALSALRLTGAPRAQTRRLVVRCGHFALFTGAQCLAREWRTIGHWLTARPPVRGAQAMDGKVSSSAP